MKSAADQRGPAPRRALALLVVLAVGLGSTACDFLDPTNVENPMTTADDLAQADRPTASLLPGLEAQFATTLGPTVAVTECVSDNFSIHSTALEAELDFPREITPAVMNHGWRGLGLYWHIQKLRALATFLLDEIVPGDETATPEEVAWAHYYRGMAYLLLGENFSAAPVEEDGIPVEAGQLLASAVTDLTQASSGGGTVGLAAQAALARTHRWLGDRTSAEAAARQVLAGDSEFLFSQAYDPTSIDNSVHWFVVARSSQDMQPLPRLDFLDPKYLDSSAGIAVAKAEEMHLILAESALAGADYAGAKVHLGDAIRLAQSRATESFIDPDQRLSRDMSVRPRDGAMVVRADADSPYRAGLVQDRAGSTTIQHTISGTSLDADSVEALPVGDPDAIWHALYLARQEILFLEGRRLADLGIRIPMMLMEIEYNPNINETSPGTTVVVPSYIPASNQMDLFSPASPYDADGVPTTNEITVQFDMNSILVTNSVSPFM